MWCWYGSFLERWGCGMDREGSRLNTLPFRTSDAAFVTRSGVSRFTIPSWSSLPQSPQLWRSPVLSNAGSSVNLGRSVIQAPLHDSCSLVTPKPSLLVECSDQGWNMTSPRRGMTTTCMAGRLVSPARVFMASSVSSTGKGVGVQLF